MTASAYYYRATLPWTLQPEDERFRLILLSTLLALTIFGAVLSQVPVPPQSREDIAIPPRLAKLIVQEAPKPPPPPPPVVEPVEPTPAPAVEEKKVEQNPVEPPKREPPPEKAAVLEPTPPQPSARERAARTGLLAMRDELADLRVDSVVQNLEKQPLRKGGASETGAASESERAIITSRATTGSGGINTSRLSRDTGGTQLAGRETTRVTAPVEETSVARSAAVEGDKTGAMPARSSEDIQMVFDRNKGTLNAIYNRALRQNPALAGKVVLKLTISPAGAVTQCELVSSELNDPELERKLVARVQLFDFGQKSAAVTTITYPIDFFPG